MHQHYYYKTLRKTIIAFLDLFNEIKVAKYDNSGEVKDLVEVPIKFAPKQKFYHWVHSHKHEKRLPMMSAEITSIDYDPERKTGKFDNIVVREDDGKEYYVTPAPYNVEFELKAASKYLVEMEQIASQILPFFDPLVYTTINIDELNDTWDIPIQLNSVSMDQESDISEEERRAILWTFSFTAKTYISKPKGNVDLIKKVVQNIYTSEEAWDKVKGDTTTQEISGGKYDTVEYLTKGSKDEDGNILISYEVFEDD